MPKLSSDFKGHKSYYEHKTEGSQLKSEAVNKVAGAKFHSKAKVSKTNPKQAKTNPF